MRALTQLTGIAAALMLLSAVAEARQQPLIEIDTRTSGAPSGYRWYIVRDWERVYSGKATGADLGENVHRMFGKGTIIFHQDVGDTLRQRRPKYPGEVSRVLLPTSFTLSGSLAMASVDDPPAVLPATKKPDVAAIRFREEPLPSGSPAGYKAYSFVYPGLVFTGIATTVNGADAGFSMSGSELDVRQAAHDGEPSHILVPPQVHIPSPLLRPKMNGSPA